MQFKAPYLSEKGMTIVSVLIASALGVIVITGFLSGMAQMYQSQRSIGLSQERDLLINEIKFDIESAGLCNASLAGVPLDTAITGSGVTFTLGGQQMPLAEGAALRDEPSLFVRTLRVETNPAIDPKNVTVNIAGAMTLLVRRTVNLVIAIDKVNSPGSSSPPRHIPFTVMSRPGTNTIAFCDTGTIAASICNETGSVWNSNVGRCVPVNKCDYGGSFSDPWVPAYAGPFPNPITGAYSCPGGYSSVRSGSLAYATSCGKGCIDNQYFPVYECVACYDAVGNSVAPGAVAGPSPTQVGINITNDLNEGEAALMTDYNNIITLWPIIF